MRDLLSSDNEQLIIYEPFSERLIKNQINFNNLNTVFPKNSVVNLCTKITEAVRKINLPYLADDFYSNLLDSSGSYIYYSIENKVYLYNYYSEKIVEIYTTPTTITSIKHNKMADMLILGTISGAIHKVNVHKNTTNEFGLTNEPNSTINTVKKHKHMYNFSEHLQSNLNLVIDFYNQSNYMPSFQNIFNSHRSRIGALINWKHCVITGSRDRRSKIIDLRTNSTVQILSTHTQEICGLALDKDMLVTGGNDNKTCVFDLRNLSSPLYYFTDHVAAVKALAIKNNVLYSGGGSADKTIKKYNLNNKKNQLEASVCFDSQITNLYITKYLNNTRLISTFGYSDDDIKLINTDGSKFKLLKKYVGHRNRVIHFAVNDNQEYFATGSGDKTIRIWKISDDMLDLRIR